MTKLIGLIGEAGSGKDTLAMYLKNNYPVETYALADPIKEITRNLFLFDDEQLYGSKKNIVDERWNITPRKSWQMIGTNIMQFGIYSLLPEMLEKVPVRQFWIHHFKMWYQKFLENPDNKDKIIIVTDIRFIHEANMIKELSGSLIKIERPNLDKSSNIYNHSSETESSTIKYDYYIENNSSLDELYDNGNKIMKQLL